MTDAEVDRPDVERLTAAALFDLPDDGRSAELVGGEVLAKLDGGGVHGEIGARVYLRLARFVEEHGLGQVPLPGTGFELDPHTVRKPDIAFVPATQWQRPPPVGFLPYRRLWPSRSSPRTTRCGRSRRRCATTSTRAATKCGW